VRHRIQWQPRSLSFLDDRSNFAARSVHFVQGTWSAARDTPHV